VTLPVDGGRIVFAFEQLSPRAQKFDADLTVTPQVIGVSSEPFSAHIDLRSLSSINTFRTTLDKLYDPKLIDWTRLLQRAGQMAKQEYLSAAVAIDIEGVEVSFETRYRIEGLVPDEGITIIFGQGSSAKTYLALEMLLAINAGRPFMGRATRQGSGLYFDQEAGERPIARRRHRLILGGPDATISEGAFHYMPGRAIPIAEQMPTVKREIARTGAQVLIVDSAVSALGADAKKEDEVARMLSPLAALGIPVIILAHVTKEGGEDYPFGSIFWHNLARMTWFVRRVDSEDSPDIQVGFYNKKANDDRRQKTFGIAVRFDDPDGPVTVEACDVAAVPELAHGLSAREQIRRALENAGQSLTVEEIHNVTDIPEKTVRNTLTAMRNQKQVVHLVARGTQLAGKWALLSNVVVDSQDSRFGPAAVGSPALTAYAGMTPHEG
jgi:hypothetical protein